MKALDELIESFDEKKRERLLSLVDNYQLTDSQTLELLKDEADLELWQETSALDIFDYPLIDSRQGKRKAEELMKELRSYTHNLRYSPTDYSTFNPPKIIRAKSEEEVFTDDSIRLMGKCPCPVDGEKTRCCKLTTLDAVSQCAFGCSYCSVQSFYSKNKIGVVSNLSDRLKCIDTEGIWHIGTGQASDSLLLGDSHGTLSALCEFALSHPDIVIELKSKSPRRDFMKMEFPRNMVFTWSLNAETIIKKEEHLTATLDERIESARIMADKGNLVGFHIHPMVYFKNWQDEYRKVVEKIVATFSPSELCQISFGTLTFTKAVLQYLRTHRTPSRVLSMPLVEAAGKYSYTLEIKEEMFKTVYSYFPKEFKENVFFYLCMEDPSLWMKCLEREYSCDKEFEEDMKKHYLEKVRASSSSKV
ncbi:MAG: DNA photolyase [Sphaerochaetaceae bacterium]|nr:DNA photolyase [Sphaerochaetaceae bacterium]